MPSGRFAIGILSFGVLTVGAYMLVLVFSPAAGPLTVMKPIDVRALPAPTLSGNRVIIPKIGVDIAYSTGTISLDRGAEWRHPDRGNPQKGGNFILAAHRFSIQPTPQDTIIKSPFYNIDKLVQGDKIIVDYDGKRYGYSVEQIKKVKPTEVEIESPSDSHKMTLYSCELGGAKEDRVVLVSRPLGLIAIE